MAREQTLEQLWGPHFRGPDRVDTTPVYGGETYANRTTVASGSASQTVSTAAVTSDSIITYSVEVSTVGPLVNSGGWIGVNSIVDGVSFAFAWATGTAVPADVTVMWRLTHT